MKHGPNTPLDAASTAFVAAAANLCADLMSDMRDLLAHSQRVAERAAELAVTIPAHQRGLLVGAAWLHDIAYAPRVRNVGFHPLDGADYLNAAGGPQRLAELVAHHSGARYVAEVRGMSAQLARYHFSESPLTDALTYADQTVGPDGGRMRLEDRIAEVSVRHGPDSPTPRPGSTGSPICTPPPHASKRY